MTFVRRRGGSYALIVSYREGGKVKQRYVRMSTSAEAEGHEAAESTTAGCLPHIHE
jgi:hypothetical protein